jgi:hypothetical protein
MTMKRLRRLGLGAFVIGALWSAACAPSSDGGSPGTAGAGGGSGTAGSGSAGTTGNGGSTAGTTGTAGSSSGAGGTATGGTAPAGSAGATGGAVAGAGGTAAGNAGRGGAGGRGGSAGTAVTGGRGGGAGAAGGGQGGTAGAGSGDEYVSGVTVTVNPMVNTILVVSWTQAKAAEQVWLEFSFAGSSVMTSRMAAGATGAHKDVVLGVPGSTAVNVRIVSRQGGVDYKTRDYMGTTGAVPSGMPVPMISMYDATLASPDRYMFGAVENAGGCTNRSCYLVGPYWVYIMDRQGRIVWYYSDTTSNAATSFPRVARDGEYIWIDKARTGTRSVHKTTLDRTTFTQTVAVSGLSDAIDVTTDGGLLYEVNGDLRELTKAGTTRNIWSCRTAMGSSYNCYSNTVNWNPTDDTVLMSFPEPNTVVQINRATGTLVATYGDFAGSYTFSPATWSFEFQHFPNITAAGTLLVSTHLSAFPEGSAAGANQHAFVEFTIDRTAKRLTEKWSYTGAYWPLSRGMAMRLANGNTLVNYGTNGIIQEITADKKIVFQVKFDHPTGTNDFYNRLVGHNVLINDLYALNGGGPK